MIKWGLFALVILLIGFYFVLLRRPGRIGNAVREYAALEQWSAFNAGYRAALLDSETLRPLTEKRTRESVKRAFRRTYIERDPEE